MEDIRKRIDELTAQLNEASRAYYDDASEIMTNYEYDELYDELLRLEAESGYVPEDSPSQNVGYTVQSELPKEQKKNMKPPCFLWIRRKTGKFFESL